MLNPKGRVWNVTAGPTFSDQDVAYLSGLRHLISFTKYNFPKPSDAFTDTGVERLSQLPQLQGIMIGACPMVTDQALKFLARNRKIRWLILNCVRLTDEGTSSLVEMRQLLKFGCSGTSVSDRSVHHLSELTELRRLVLGDCEFSRASLRVLQEALQRCLIVHDSHDVS